jgi:hypothetical protein
MTLAANDWLGWVDLRHIADVIDGVLVFIQESERAPRRCGHLLNVITAMQMANRRRAECHCYTTANNAGTVNDSDVSNSIPSARIPATFRYKLNLEAHSLPRKPARPCTTYY